MGRMRKGDFPVKFSVTMKKQEIPTDDFDISTMTTTEMIFKSPTGVKKTYDGVATGAVLDWSTTVSTDIDEKGSWELEVHLAKSGYDKTSTIFTFHVDDTL